MPAPRMPSGLFYRIDRAGRKSYYCDFHCARVRVFKSFGAVTIQEASTFIDFERKKIRFDALGYPLDERAEAKTLTEALKDYIRTREDKDTDTIEKNVNRLSALLPMRVDRITKCLIQRGVDDLREKYSPRSIKNSLTCLSAVLNHCIREGWVKHNPAPAVSVTIKARPRRPEQWSPVHDEAILSELTDTYDRVIFLLALDMGLRKDSIRHIERDDVLIRANKAGVMTCRIIIRVLKGDKPEEAKWSFSGRLIRALKEHQKNTAGVTSKWLFPGERPLVPKSMQRHVGKIQDAIEKVTGRHSWLHDLRHMFVTRAQSGIDNEHVVMALSSHDSVRAHRIYSDLNSEIGGELMEKSLTDFSEKFHGIMLESETVQ